MAVTVGDTTCTLHPYFKIHEGKEQQFKANCDKFYELVKNEEGFVFFGFSFAEDRQAFCREGYKSGAAILKHVENVDGPLKAVLELADITRFEFHGPASEAEVVRETLAPLGTVFFILDNKGLKNNR